LGSGYAAAVRLQDRTVSSLHCELRADDDGVVVSDFGSKNGVFVGGARVPQARLDMSGSASFVIGRSTVTVRPARAARRRRPTRCPASSEARSPCGASPKKFGATPARVLRS